MNRDDRIYISTLVGCTLGFGLAAIWLDTLSARLLCACGAILCLFLALCTRLVK